MVVPERAVHAAAEALGERAEVDEELVVGGLDELVGCGVEGDAGEDDVDVGMVADFPVPGVEHAGVAAFRAVVFRRDDIGEGSGAFPQDQGVEDV